MSDPKPNDNLALPFQLDKTGLRGRFVRLGSCLDDILSRHNYPLPVATLLGEACVIAVALRATLKIDGVLTFQIKSEGAVRFLVVDVTAEGALRACAGFSPEKLDVAPLLEKGTLAFTLDRLHDEARYQGIVALETEGLSSAVQHYFRQSEQIPTGLLAHVRRDEYGRWRGGALMLQQMPREGGVSAQTDTCIEDDWHRSMLLMKTCTALELTDETLSASDLLFRLFHEEGVRIYDPLGFHSECRCSRERVTEMLKAMPKDNVAEMAKDGVITVTCEFCGRVYVDTV